MTDTKPPSAEALAFLDECNVHPEHRWVATLIDAFAARRAVEARREIEAIAAILDGTARGLRHCGMWANADDIERQTTKLRALADKPAAGKAEP